MKKIKLKFMCKHTCRNIFRTDKWRSIIDFENEVVIETTCPKCGHRVARYCGGLNTIFERLLNLEVLVDDNIINKDTKIENID